MKKLACTLSAVALAAFLATPAFAVHRPDHIPSSKIGIALGDLVNLGVASANTSTPADHTDTTGYVTVLQTYIKTSNQADLYFDVSLQCGIITDTTVKSKGGTKDTAKAAGRIAVRVKITDLATDTYSYAQPSAPSAEEINQFGGDFASIEGVTFCSRVQQLDASFAGLTCTADLTTGVVTCVDPEELRLLLKTLNANAFNFAYADAPPGVKRIEVEAMGEANVLLSGTGLGSAQADAFVGLGSMIVETGRLIKDVEFGPIVDLE